MPLIFPPGCQILLIFRGFKDPQIMKTRLLRLALILLCAVNAGAQDIGRVIIRNANPSFPKFIVSMNGIRLSNEYAQKVEFNYLDEFTYKINILQAGSRTTLSFMVYSAPNYVSTYVINKDTYGNYLFALESKTLMTESAEPATGTVTPSATVAIAKPEPGPPATTVPTLSAKEPATSAAPPKTMDEGEYFEIIKTLKKESLEKNRLEMAKTFFAGKYMYASMIKDLLKIFSLEASKLTYAKHAYPFCVDKQNYYKVFDALSLSNSKKNLTEFIKANP